MIRGFSIGALVTVMKNTVNSEIFARVYFLENKTAKWPNHSVVY